MTLTEQQKAEIEARVNAATSGTDANLTRYDHGGGRMWVDQPGEGRELIADFYNEPDREFLYHAHDDVESLIASLRAARKALKDLVDQLDVVHNSPEYIGVWTLSQLHDGYYKGPTYTDALAAARAALKSE